MTKSIISILLVLCSFVRVIEGKLSRDGKPRNLKLKENLLSKSRRLEDEEEDNNDFPYDLTSYGVKFTKCQYVKMYDEEQSKYTSSVFTMKQFVIYRLCPLDSCDYCGSNYGQYVVETDDYLQHVAEQHRDNFEDMCEYCDRECENNNNNYYCRKCWQCEKVEELEESGYVDATYLAACQKVQNGDDDDGNSNILYTGPRCNKEGNSIKIDVFSDYQCTQPYSVSIETVLGYKLHYYVLQHALGTSCTSCVESRDNNEDEDRDEDEDENETLEFCKDLYTGSAKCETKHGFKNGISTYGDSSVELDNEFDVCTFIESLIWNSYDQKGEIDTYDPQDTMLRSITTVQRLSLCCLTVISMTFIIYANYLKKKIAKYNNLEMPFISEIPQNMGM